MFEEYNCLSYLEYFRTMPFTKKHIVFPNTLKLKQGCWETEIDWLIYLLFFLKDIRHVFLL